MGAHVLGCSLVADSLWFARTGTCQALLSMGFSRQEYWSGLLFLPPGGLPDPGIDSPPVSPALAGGFFTTVPPGKRSVQKRLKSGLIEVVLHVGFWAAWGLYPLSPPWVPLRVQWMWLAVLVGSLMVGSLHCLLEWQATFFHSVKKKVVFLRWFYVDLFC